MGRVVQASLEKGKGLRMQAEVTAELLPGSPVCRHCVLHSECSAHPVLTPRLLAA